MAEENAADDAPQPDDDTKNLILEADTLVLFIAQRGSMLTTDQTRQTAFEGLRDAVALAKTGTDDNRKELLDAYAKVTAFTYAEHGINGRTILDTNGQLLHRIDSVGKSGNGNWLNHRWLRPRYHPLIFGIALLLMAFIYEGVLILAEDMKEFHKTLVSVKQLLVPLVWGALGACTFLMKKFSDKLSTFSFEEVRARGMITRAFLGAILGLIVVELLRVNFGGPDSPFEFSGMVTNVDCKPLDLACKLPGFPVYLVAFLAGLGIKPVYAAIEGIVEGLALRINPWKAGGKK